MAERRVSGWFVLSAVFIVLVFGMFFTFTERKTWPEHRIELGPMDMRLVPSVSTFWCEAVALHSEHSFVAYQVNRSTRINPVRMNSQTVNLQMRLHGSPNSNSMKFKYFLLPSSVIGIVACSSSPIVKLMVFKGDLDVQKCLQSFAYNDYQKSSEYSSETESSEEEEEKENSNYKSYMERSSSDIMSYMKECSSLVHYQTVETAYIDEYSTDCSPTLESRPVKVNVTSADFYVIVVWNTNRHVTNLVNLQVMLDRTRYIVRTSGQTLDICPLSDSCTIGLDFASGDRVLVSMPEEPNAGRQSFMVRSRCKPRLAVFAVLSVILPLLLFLVVAYVVRTDRDSVGRFFCKTRQSSEGRLPRSQRIATPLLDDRSAGSTQSFPETDRSGTAFVQIEDMPPPYHSLYDPPPPYACVKNSDNINTQRG